MVRCWGIRHVCFVAPMTGNTLWPMLLGSVTLFPNSYVVIIPNHYMFIAFLFATSQFPHLRISIWKYVTALSCNPMGITINKVHATVFHLDMIHTESLIHISYRKFGLIALCAWSNQKHRNATSFTRLLVHWMHDTLEEINSCASFNRMLECSLSIPPCRSPGTRTIPLMRTRSVAPALSALAASPRHSPAGMVVSAVSTGQTRPSSYHIPLSRALALTLHLRNRPVQQWRQYCDNIATMTTISLLFNKI